MKKEITAVGKNGEFKGELEIKFDVGTTRVLDKQVGIHKVIATYDGKIVAESEDIVGKTNIPRHAELVEKALQNYLSNLANKREYRDINEELQSLGFK